MEHLASILSVLGIGGMGVAVITAIATRKKVGADTNQTIVATADELIEGVRADLAAVRAERNDERSARIKAEGRQRRWWERADKHDPWDRHMMRLCDEAGISYPAKPELYPADGE